MAAVEKNTVDIIDTENRFGDNIPFDRKAVPRTQWHRIKFSVENVKTTGHRPPLKPASFDEMDDDGLLDIYKRRPVAKTCPQENPSHTGISRFPRANPRFRAPLSPAIPSLCTVCPQACPMTSVSVSNIIARH